MPIPHAYLTVHLFHRECLPKQYRCCLKSWKPSIHRIGSPSNAQTTQHDSNMLQLAGPFLVWSTQHYHTPRQQIGMPNADGCGEILGPHWNNFLETHLWTNEIIVAKASSNSKVHLPMDFRLAPKILTRWP